MLDHILEWAQLLVRWFHVIVGAAWIGTSFYFNWLNHSLRPPEQEGDGVGGELWAVHGGGFYRVTKYKVAPSKLPKTLHWFKWEAYFTWISGATLLVLVYYLGAEGLLVDSTVADISRIAAVGLGAGTLIVGWFFYDVLCKSPLRNNPTLLAVIGLSAAVAVAFGLCQYLNPRAAYIHFGAMLGTCMAANVFFVIIPGQRLMVDAMIEGRDPDPEPGKAGALRSLHNNYLTLPVLYIMVSSHHPITYGHEWNWAILCVLSLAGAGVRHWFNLRGRGELNQWILPVAALLIVGLAFVTRPVKIEARATAINFATEIHPIITQRCTPCHAQKSTYPGMVGPQGGILLETPEQMKSQAANIMKNAVQNRIMPLGNLTKITEAERTLLGQWIQSGASIK